MWSNPTRGMPLNPSFDHTKKIKSGLSQEMNSLHVNEKL
jgi:hypothetical protein